MPTQADVAALAGVSRRTVSNVINGYPHVSADVLHRVSSAIAELGYTPSHAARSLRLGRSNVIQLVVPELDVPYFSELSRGIVETAQERGYIVMVRQTLGDLEAEREALHGSTGDYTEGTILSPVNSALGWLQEDPPRRPVVLIGEHAGSTDFTHVGIDDEAAAYDATRHLLDRGRRRIAFVGSDPHGGLVMAHKRESGYRGALDDAGVTPDERLVVPTGHYHRADGKDALARIWGDLERPDAVFCATDLLAIGVLRQANDLGVQVPHELAVVGFDDLEEGRYSVPSLTTISPDKAEIARATVSALVHRIEGNGKGATEPDAETRTSYRLCIRESTRLAT